MKARFSAAPDGFASVLRNIQEAARARFVKPDVALRQFEAERADTAHPELVGTATGGIQTGVRPAESGERKPDAREPKRFHATASLDPTRVGRDASQIADEVISHLNSLVGAEVRVTLEIDATIPTGAPEQVVGTVTENCKSLKFTQQGFEED